MEFTNEMPYDTLEYTARSLHTLFRRCVQCPSTTPSCPACKSDEVCVQISETCDQCASRTCIKASDSGATPVTSGSHGPNVGAIAGGVVGGVAVIAIITFLIWRFFIKNRRQNVDETEEYEEDELEETESEKAANGNGRRGSAATGRRSMASTVLTRASNVIPIAFIPGIVDRSGRNVVPPVPIPTSNNQTPYTDHPADHYFMPSDLRDSHYSGFTDDGASTAGRASLTPSLLRGSIASTVYRNDAVVAAGQTAQRGKAAVVSVHGPVPAVPRIDYEKYGEQAPLSSPAGQGSGQQLPASTFSPAPRIAASTQQRPLSNPLSDLHAVDEEEAVALSSASMSQQLQSKHAKKVSSGQANLSAIIEEATRRASREPTHGGLGSVQQKRGESPFGDEHEVVEEDGEASMI